MTKKKHDLQKNSLGEMDKRIIEKEIREGSIKKEDLNKYLNELPDVSENAEEVIIALGHRP